MHFRWLSLKGPFVDEALRTDLRRRLNEVPGVEIPEGSIARLHNVWFPDPPDDGSVDRILGAYAWVVETIRDATR